MWDEWKFSARMAWQDSFLRWMSSLTVGAYILMSGFFLLRLIPVGLRSGVLILHYTIYLGIDEVRPWRWIFLYPAGMLGLLVMNGICAYGMYRTDRLAAKTLMSATAALCLLWCIGAWFNMLVNV